MITQFKEKKVQKKYFALVDGKVRNKSGTIESYLNKIAGYQGQSLWGSVSKDKGLYAQTHWKI